MRHTEGIIEAFGKHVAERLVAENRQCAADSLQSLMNKGRVFSESLCQVEGGLLGMMDLEGNSILIVVSKRGEMPKWSTRFHGESLEIPGLRVLLAKLTPENAASLRQIVPYTNPQVLGLKPSFGFGDRLGLATPGHTLAAADAQGRILPIFVQQSIREMSRTERTAQDVMDDATWGVFRSGWDMPFGADADHLKTKADVEATARAGCVFFTIDPSEHVDQQADDYDPFKIEEKYQALIASKVEGASDLIKLYRGTTFEVANDQQSIRVTFDELSLKRASVKYGGALAHTYKMADYVAMLMGSKPFELELSVDETSQPTSILEHLFIALELKRHGTSIVSLAPRFIGDFEKAIDYIGDLAVFETSLKKHALIAEQFGPYKISVHRGSDKFSIYPSLGRICSERFHVKTAGTSYMEALRVVCRVDKGFFREIVQFCRDRFETDRASYYISSRLDLVPDADRLTDEDLEQVYLNQDNGRQILHVRFGSVLTQRTVEGSYRFRDRILTLLRQNQQLHKEFLHSHLGRHIQLLLMG